MWASAAHSRQCAPPINVTGDTHDQYFETEHDDGGSRLMWLGFRSAFHSWTISEVRCYSWHAIPCCQLIDCWTTAMFTRKYAAYRTPSTSISSRCSLGTSIFPQTWWMANTGEELRKAKYGNRNSDELTLKD